MDAVLADIDGWFQAHLFDPLERSPDPAAAIRSMMAEVTRYFHSGQRVCLVGWVSLGASGDTFAPRVAGYFARWIAALSACLARGGVAAAPARALAEETVGAIQGAIVLSRALDDRAAFGRIVGRHEALLLQAVAVARAGPA
ncbi:LmrA/YxaF family transcription factor [Sphingomonas folli]|uniref:LmrA/YxaF family transcription factor n=1 Tax=Sphingomonas folli TaxID=2862497 RepID=UPI00215646C0|nr:TetR/AcrR family transcriptional regulator [Sphingomonas folli]